MGEENRRWRCPYCDGLNDWQNTVCEICGEGKRSEVVRPEAGNAAASKAGEIPRTAGMQAGEAPRGLNPSSLYDQALLIMQNATDERSYFTAAELFRALGEYRDAPAKAMECRQRAEQARFTTGEKKHKARHKGRAGLILFLILAIAAGIMGYIRKNGIPDSKGYGKQEFIVGNTVRFGHYEQDNNTGNGKEVIEWLVLRNDGMTATLISKYGLDARAYNREYDDVTWETCSLRKWLNNEFIDTAFDAKEQARLITGTFTAEGNPKYNTDAGNDTQDKVCLLSVFDANSMLDSSNVRSCQPTIFAGAKKLHTSNSTSQTGWWWLRSPGANSSSAARVNDDGNIDLKGSYVYIDTGLVRPVIRIQLPN